MQETVDTFQLNAWEFRKPPDHQKHRDYKPDKSESYFPRLDFCQKQVRPALKAIHDYDVESKAAWRGILYPVGNSLRASLEDEITNATFHALAEQWKRETGHFSIFSQKAMHPLYQGIIKLGERALPVLIKELDKSPRNWFWALRKISGCNPVKEGASVEEAVEAWKRWWNDRSQKHVVLALDFA